MWRLVAWLVFVFLAVCSPAAFAWAQAAPASEATPAAEPPPDQTRTVADALSLTPGPTCLEEARLERRVARWLERERISDDIQVRVSGGPEPNQASFVLTRGDAPPTERVLSEVPGDCGDQHSAVALSIALAIDATLLGPLPPGEHEPERKQPGQRPVIRMPPPEPVEEHDPFRVSVGAGYGVGFLSQVAPVALAALHVEPVRGFELRATGRWSGRYGETWPDVPITYSEQLWTGGLAVCPVVRPVPGLSGAACAEFVGGVFRTRASGLSNSRSQSSAYWAAGLGLDIRGHLTEWLGVRFMAELFLPFVPRALRVQNISNGDDKREDLLPTSVFLGLAPFVSF